MLPVIHNTESRKKWLSTIQRGSNPLFINVVTHCYPQFGREVTNYPEKRLPTIQKRDYHYTKTKVTNFSEKKVTNYGEKEVINYAEKDVTNFAEKRLPNI